MLNSCRSRHAVVAIAGELRLPCTVSPSPKSPWFSEQLHLGNWGPETVKTRLCSTNECVAVLGWKEDLCGGGEVRVGGWMSGTLPRTFFLTQDGTVLWLHPTHFPLHPPIISSPPPASMRASQSLPIGLEPADLMLLQCPWVSLPVPAITQGNGRASFSFTSLRLKMLLLSSLSILILHKSWLCTRIKCPPWCHVLRKVLWLLIICWVIIAHHAVIATP